MSFETEILTKLSDLKEEILPRLAGIETSLKYIQDAENNNKQNITSRLDGHDSDLYGNGKPGVIKDVETIKTILSTTKANVIIGASLFSILINVLFHFINRG